MINSAIIELIGYVGKDPKSPSEENYPNWVVFSIAVSKSWKDKQGVEQKETQWFECKTISETMAKIVKNHVKQGTALLLRGYPKAKAFVDNTGNPQATIEVTINHINVLTPGKNLNEKKEEKSYNNNDDEIPF